MPTPPSPGPLRRVDGLHWLVYEVSFSAVAGRRSFQSNDRALSRLDVIIEVPGCEGPGNGGSYLERLRTLTWNIQKLYPRESKYPYMRY